MACEGGAPMAREGGAGIVSSYAANDARHLTAVGVANGFTGTFDGVTISPGDVVAKYTYYGDANLDGSVSSADYTRIDAGFLSHGTLTGWANGDFNYDGVVNGSDYTLIDNAFNMQGASLAAAVASPTLETSSVPEPAGVMVLVAGVLLSRRRRHQAYLSHCWADSFHTKTI